MNGSRGRSIRPHATNFKTIDMRTSNIITSLLIASGMTSIIGIMQSHTLIEFNCFLFGAIMSGLLLGLIAKEK